MNKLVNIYLYVLLNGLGLKVQLLFCLDINNLVKILPVKCREAERLFLKNRTSHVQQIQIKRRVKET